MPCFGLDNIGTVPGHIGPHTVLNPVIVGARSSVTLPTTTVLDVPARLAQITITVPTNREHNRNVRFALDQQGIHYSVQEFDDVTHWSVPEDQASRARTIIAQPGKYFGELSFLAGPVAKRIAHHAILRAGRLGMGAITPWSLLTRLPTTTASGTGSTVSQPVAAPSAAVASPAAGATAQVPSTGVTVQLPVVTAGPSYAQITARVASSAITQGPLSSYENALQAYERQQRELMQHRVSELIAAGMTPESAWDQARREYEQAMAIERQRLQSVATDQSVAIVDKAAELVGQKIESGQAQPPTPFPWWIIVLAGSMLL